MYLNSILNRFEYLLPSSIDKYTFTNEYNIVLQRIEFYFTFYGSGASSKDISNKIKKAAENLVAILDSRSLI